MAKTAVQIVKRIQLNSLESSLELFKMAPSSHQPSTTKLLVIFIVASLSILAINDLVLFEGLKNSMKQGKFQ